MQLLRQSTVATVYVGPVLDSAGAAVTTAVLGDFRLVKNGTPATLTGATVTHDANGYYTIALTTGNTDTTGRLDIGVGNAAMSMANHRFNVRLASVFDAMVVNATNATGGLPTATGSISAFAGAISTFAGLGANAPANWINAAAIASNAIEAAKIASNAITDAKIASNAITSAKIAADAIGASQIAANAITDAKINTGAITSAKFAAGAFDAVWEVTTRALSTTGVAAIVTAVWDELTSTIRVIGSYGERIAGNLNAQVSTRATQTSVDDVPTNAEFNARTLPSADYATSALLTTVAGYLDTEIAAILEDTGTTIPAQITALNNISTAQVLAQCTAALETAITELSSVPSATPTTKQALMFLYMALRNRTTTTASAQTIQNDAGTTIATATLSDDGTTMTKGEFA